MDKAKSGKGAEVDLFGQPIEPLRERRGRPSYKKTQENQRFVEVRAAAGWSRKAIAADMGIDEDTLRKHFSAEMENGALKIQGALLDVLLQNARKGHVPSVRVLQDQIAKSGPKAPRAQKVDQVQPELPKAKALGKKEQAIEAAQQIPDDWGDLMSRRENRRN